jgi:hypothetical protein
MSWLKILLVVGVIAVVLAAAAVSYFIVIWALSGG